MKPLIPPSQTRADVIWRQMAIGFLGLAVFFWLGGVVDFMDGSIHTRAGAILRTQSPELFARMLRLRFGFGAGMIAVAAAFAVLARLSRAR